MDDCAILKLLFILIYKQNMWWLKWLNGDDDDDMYLLHGLSLPLKDTTTLQISWLYIKKYAQNYLTQHLMNENQLTEVKLYENNKKLLIRIFNSRD